MSIVKVLVRDGFGQLPRVLAIFGCFLLSLPASALDCENIKIFRIQAETDKVLVQVTLSPAGWKNLGAWSLPATRPFLAVAQQAVAMNRPVMLRYTGNVDCGATDLANIPIAIRLDESE